MTLARLAGALRRLFLALGVAAALLSAALYIILRRSLPKTRGRLRLPGLQAPVEVLRDSWGVPHIYAGSLEDAFFASGFVQAQDRFWQMELNRRMAAGRLAEMFGPDALDLDQLVRRIGFHRAAQQEWDEMEADERSLLEAYSAGVNACLEVSRLPVEFSLLRLRPECWRPLDTLTFARFMNWGLAGNWDEELVRSWTIARFGPEAAAQFDTIYPAGEPLTVPSGAEATATPDLSHEYREALALPGLGPGMSNAWVVDGEKSATGKPLLANDPHLTLSMPSIWYEMHLDTPTLKAAGAGMAGIPGIIIGHNEKTAWGVTAALIDGDDLFVQRLNPADPSQYEYEGHWEQGELIREEIRVRGRSQPVVEEVLITRHGPVINVGAGQGCIDGEERTLALRTVGLEKARQVLGLVLLMRAGGWEEFREAARHWPGSSINFLYADIEGNIGYQMSGLIPLRRRGHGLAPVPGWSGEYDWLGFLPYEELPYAFNPETHWLANANNPPSGNSGPLFSTRYANSYRIRRITHLLESKQRLSTDDFSAMQADVYSIPGALFAGWISGLSPQDHWQERAQTFVRAWNHELAADSVAAAIVEAFATNLTRIAVREKLADHAGFYLGKSVHPLRRSGTFFGGSAAWLVDKVNGQPDWFAARSWRQAMQQALADAIQELRRLLGDDMSTWHWGRLHGQTFSHVLGAKRWLAPIFNRGPTPLGGDANTLNQAAFAPQDGYSVNRWAASWRQIIDLSNFNNSRAVLPGGQSGHPGSRHYGDMIRRWQRGQYHPMPWDRSEVERYTEGRLHLSPAAGKTTPESEDV